MPAEHVGLLVPTLGGGGAERVMVNIANALAERGVTVDLVVFTGEGPFRSALHPEVRLVDLGTVRARSSLLALIRYLRRRRPHSLLATHDRANVLAVAARRLAGVPTRVVVREASTFSVGLEDEQGSAGRWFARMVRWAYMRADAVVAVSQGVAEDLTRSLGIPAERIDVIGNPVVTPALPERAAVAPDDPWLGDPEAPLILAVGRLNPAKDFRTLLRAFALLAPTVPARLLVLGEGAEREALERLAAELGIAERVRLPGFVENPYGYMARADAFVLSSAWEGLPGALIEALACGCPVVSTDCPSGPREILEDGRYGPLVPVGRPEALAQAVLEVLREPLPPETLRSAAERYTQQTVTDRYSALLLPASATPSRSGERSERSETSAV